MTTIHSGSGSPSTHFSVPDGRTATEPPEHRGLTRDGVRLLIADRHGVEHSQFSRLDEFLSAGDLLLVNTSATVAAELDAHQSGGWPAVVHFATELDDATWVVELRRAPDGDRPILYAESGDVILLNHGVRIQLIEPYPGPRDPGSSASPTGRGTRLWRAMILSAGRMADYLERYGRPISYGYLRDRWPLEDYQTIFAREPGSAEMASAARPFTPELVVRLITKGILLAPITLHTGVSSQQAGEPPQAERFTVPASTARLVNHTRAHGGRVIAVGTTATRAIESALDSEGVVHATTGWTTLVLGPNRAVRVVDGLITGWHDPEASHLLLVESVVGARTSQLAYEAAVANGYLWHEFGDAGLLLR